MLEVSHFNTQEVRPWHNPQRYTSKVIGLRQIYNSLPQLVVGLNSLDIMSGTNVRVIASATHVESDRYTAHADSWGDTKLYSAEMDALVLSAGNDVLSGEFNTQEDHPWNQPQRCTSRRIVFQKQFEAPPRVIAFLRELDTGQGSSTRIITSATDIDCSGFTMHIDTWACTVLYSAVACWIACPSSDTRLFTASVDTRNVRSWHDPQVSTSQEISFNGATFERQPSVFVALNSIDINASRNLRIRTYVDRITRTNLVWHADCWGDTILYSAGASILAFS